MRQVNGELILTVDIRESRTDTAKAVPHAKG